MKRFRIACLALGLTAGFVFPAVAEEPSLPASAEAVAAPEPAAKADDAVSADAAATPAVVEAAKTESASADAAPVAKEAAATANAQDDPVICKRYEATGTRLRKGKVCKPQSVWKQQEQRAEEIMTGIERNSSIGVGGSTDPGGT